MTSDTKLYLAVGVLAVLGGAYYLQTQKRAEETKAHSYAAQTAALPEIKVTDDDIKKIDKVVLETPEEKADGDKEKKAAAKHVLVKQGEEWKLDEPVKALANQANVESLLKNLKTLKVKEQITKDPKDFAKYELGDKEAVHATFYKGKDVAYEFWFGKSGGVGQMTRIKGQEGGYAVDGYSSYLYSRDTKGWRDLTIFKFDEKKVKAVELQNEHGMFAFTKDGGEIAMEMCVEHAASNGWHNGSHLPAEGLHLPSKVNKLEKDLVEEALRRTAGNQTRAAELLQIPVHALRHLLDKHALR
jgi:hypothetical protein